MGVAAFAALAPDSIRDGLATWRPGFAWLVVFLLVAGQSISVLVDVRLMALRRWSLVFWRSLLIAVLRLPFLLWVPDTGAALYVYVVACGRLRDHRCRVPRAPGAPGWLRLRPLPADARHALRFAGVNYLGQLAVQAPFFAVPFVVLVQVDAVENASFYLSWGVMSVVYISVQMIGQALLVEGGRGAPTTGAKPRWRSEWGWPSLSRPRWCRLGSVRFSPACMGPTMAPSPRFSRCSSPARSPSP